MFDIQKYINSGVIEAYCLGTATNQEKVALEELSKKFPLVKQALERTQLALIQYVGIHQKPIKRDLESNILARIEALQFDSPQLQTEKKRLANFIQISNYSKLADWQALVKPIKEPTDFEVHTHTLFKDQHRKLYLVWIKDYIEEEAHTDTEEKFFILSGTCTCTLNNKKVFLHPGSFIDVPVNQYHNLKVTSKEPIKMIISKRKVA